MYFEIDDYSALKAALRNMCIKFSLENVPEETLFDSKLVATELLSNVLQHGGGTAYFRAELHDGKIMLSVRSTNDFRPPEQSSCSEATAERGRGLFLVDTICEDRDYNERDGICVHIRIHQVKKIEQ